jgi:HSP20 family molecular chaperone IbpA
MTDTKELRETPRPAAPANQTRSAAYTPRADVLETDDAFWVRADLPGVRPDGVSLHCQEGQLVLRARCEPRHAGKRPLLWEYGVGDYVRTFALGGQVDTTRIEANLADGVLTVRLPKTEAARPRRIPVKGG